LYYLITISIFTNVFIQIPGIVGERLAFFPSLGFCIALAWGIFKILKIPLDSKEIPKNKLLQLAVLVLLAMVPYSAKTIARNTQWKDYLTLYSHDIKYLANSVKANDVYASQLLKEAFNNETKNLSPAEQKQYLARAIEHIKKSVEIDSTYKFAWNNLGFISAQYLGKPEEAVSYLQKAVALDPAYADAWFNMAYAYEQTGQFEDAKAALKEALAVRPHEAKYLTAIANVSFKQNDFLKALDHYNSAATIEPGIKEPYIGLANCYWMTGDTAMAINNWEKAFAIDPFNLVVCRNLAGYFNQKGGPKAAYYTGKLSELQKVNK
jgi:tetratricopeptide (TPR) repeat protein